MNICKQCGKVIPIKYKNEKRKFCNNTCQAKFQTIDIDIAEIQRLYRGTKEIKGLTYREIGEKFGVSTKLINDRINKYGYGEEKD